MSVFGHPGVRWRTKEIFNARVQNNLDLLSKTTQPHPKQKNMNKIILWAALLLFSTGSFAQAKISITQKTGFSIGETIEFRSGILNENRVLNLYLPAGYRTDSLKQYPVIYLLDGSADEDFIHIAGLVQFGSFSWINMIPETIVVGISNVDRRRDFTFPTRNEQDKKDYPTTGGSEKFIRFLEAELIPLIQQQYRTDTPKTLIGQSLGGLLATEILLKKPDLFDNYIIVSPSLWWDDESLLQAAPQPYTSGKSVYIAVGNEDPVMKRDAAALFKKLGAGAMKNTRLFYNFLEQQDHGDALHLAVYDSFEKIFRKAKE